MTTATSTETVRDEVRSRYAAAARAVTAGGTGCCGEGGSGCCGDAEATGSFGESYYSDAERAELPLAAKASGLGCGNPLAVADLHEGETVLDLGSGGGGDVLLSARRVGPTGRVYGLDMTDEMLDLARRNIAEAGATNVELRKGHIEQIPLSDASVDVVISNCVINLSVDKPAVFAQMHRVLRPGGRVGVSDIVADDDLTPEQRAERGDWSSCAAGALSRSEYVDGLTTAGFSGVEVSYTHQVADGMHSAIVRATRP
jgi:SAM-dependent methyltransferase